MTSIEPALMWLAGICAAIATIWGLSSKVSAAVKKPTVELKADLESLKTRTEILESLAAANKDKLTHDHESLAAQEEINWMLLKSVSLLLKHNADGNHTGELAKQASEIDHYIYKKGGAL